jgi:hypothetical protein
MHPSIDSLPVVAATFHEPCLACGTCNRVEVTEQYGHNQRQPYYCAHCRHVLGTLNASVPPACLIVDDACCPEWEAENEGDLRPDSRIDAQSDKITGDPVVADPIARRAYPSTPGARP